MSNRLLKLLESCKTRISLKSIHSQLVVTGLFTSSDHVLNKLIRLYPRFGSVDDARKVFDVSSQPNAFLWTALIHGYVDNRQYEEAFSLFIHMRRNSIMPLNFTVASIFKALAKQAKVEDGEAIYGFVLKCGFNSDLIVQNAALYSFMKFGKLDFARWVFDYIDEKDVVSWNSMISGYANCGSVGIARELFDKMPDRNVISWTSMIGGYIKSGELLEAKVLFENMPCKDLASWNVMISGCMEAGDVKTAQYLFDAMPSRDIGTWNLMISGLCKAGKIESAKDIFDISPENNVVSWTIMMDGYIKSGDVDSARYLFDQMQEKNLISWSTMIGGYARNSRPHSALALFESFKEQGIKPDETFILTIISACSQLGVLDTAESVICDYVGTSALSNIQVTTSLIDMYSKCGSIERAVQVFERVKKKDLLCYSAMIAANANHGLADEAISLFDEMKRAGINPDGISFLGVLTACNHGGLVNEGQRYFKQMTDEYGIYPMEKHYACVVDLLGRAGRVEEAFNLINSMLITPHSAVWGALLAACRIHCNVQMAEVAASKLFKIEPENSGNYILLSNIYAAAGKWDGVKKVREMIRGQKIRKNKGSSWIEVGNKVYEFVIGGMSHADSETVYLILDLLRADMKFLQYLIYSEDEETLLPSILPSEIHNCNVFEDGLLK